MFCKAPSLLAFTLFAAASLSAQSKLSAKWEELTAPDFRQGIQQSKGTCLLPFGILEKHGPHLPLGTDLLNVRYASLQAASQEYAVVFPEYYFGQIFEAKHEPGTVAYSMELQLHLLQETTEEMARDGSVATKELGEWNMKGWIDSIVECIRSVKADDASLKIQNEFYEKSKHPLDTRP